MDVLTFTSADGSNWSTNNIGVQGIDMYGFDYNFFAAAGDWMLAVGTAGFNEFIQFSKDGTQWFQTNGIPDPNIILNNIGPNAGAYGNGTYVILARTNSYHSLPPILHQPMA